MTVVGSNTPRVAIGKKKPNIRRPPERRLSKVRLIKVIG
jgi:hypothetical protein